MWDWSVCTIFSIVLSWIAIVSLLATNRGGGGVRVRWWIKLERPYQQSISALYLPTCAITHLIQRVLSRAEKHCSALCVGVSFHPWDGAISSCYLRAFTSKHRGWAMDNHTAPHCSNACALELKMHEMQIKKMKHPFAVSRRGKN